MSYFKFANIGNKLFDHLMTFKWRLDFSALNCERLRYFSQLIAGFVDILLVVK